MAKTLVLINERSGAVNTAGAGNCLAALQEIEDPNELSPHITAGDPSALVDRARIAVAEGSVEKIILLGGDGTVAALAGALADTNLPFAPLPGGTLNAYSRDVGYNSDLFSAIQQLRSTRSLRVDIGYANNHPFLNNLVFGAYTVVAQSREHLREADTLGEKAEAVTEIIGSISHSSTETYRIWADGDPQEIETNTFMIANGCYDGAELMLPKRSALDSGCLGLYLSDATTSVDFLNILLEAMTQTLSESDLLSLTRCRRCRVSTINSDLLEVTIDGEAMELPSPLDVTLKPKALSVLAPA